jgi:hypothetical protein
VELDINETVYYVVSEARQLLGLFAPEDGVKLIELAHGRVH